MKAAYDYPSSGEYRRRGDLQSVSRTPDVNGVRSDSWNTYASVWASINTKSGREQQRHDGFVDANDVEVRMRYRTGVTISHRFVCGGVTYLINDVTDVAQAHIELVLQCTEIASG